MPDRATARYLDRMMPPFTATEPFQPARGLGTGHAQTLFAHFFRSRRRPPVRRERWDTPDGDFVDVDHVGAPDDAPHVLVLHGLEGSSEASYVAALLRGIEGRGWGAVALNFRSCSGEPNRTARMYHSGETEDAAFVLSRLRARVRGPLFGVGFSLGGNVLLRLLAQDGEAAALDAGVAVSVPFDLAGCAAALDEGRGLTALYRLRFLRSLRAKALEKARRHPEALDVARIREARGIAGFDDVVTAPLHGFAGAADYYARCASGPVLREIRRPTLLISAADDPLVPPASLPREAWDNPALHILRPAVGGHVGFVAGSVLRPHWWADAQALAFLATVAAGAHATPPAPPARATAPDPR